MSFGVLHASASQGMEPIETVSYKWDSSFSFQYIT